MVYKSRIDITGIAGCTWSWVSGLCLFGHSTTSFLGNPQRQQNTLYMECDTVDGVDWELINLVLPCSLISWQTPFISSIYPKSEMGTLATTKYGCFLKWDALNHPNLDHFSIKTPFGFSDPHFKKPPFCFITGQQSL